MPKRNYIHILQEYVDYLNQLCNQTFTDSRLRLYTRQSKALVIRMQGDEILPLELEPQGWLHFRQVVTLQNSKVIVEDGRYTYSLSSNPDDENQWIFRYEYRLNPQDDYPHSHLHLNARRGGKPLRRIHFPTARVSIEQIIAHLIMEHGIQPKCDNWFDVLAESHHGFMKRRTDPPLFP